MDNPGGGTDLRRRRFQSKKNQPIQSDSGLDRVWREEEAVGRRYPGDQSRIGSRIGTRPGMQAVTVLVVSELMMLGFGNERQR